MHLTAQESDQRSVQRPARRPASRRTRLLACAAVVPVVLVAGCSMGPDDSKGQGGDAKKSAKPKPSASVAPAKFRKLPQPCKTLAGSTVKKLVPKAKSESGTSARSSDVDARGTCSWNGLDGYQYRWLDVSFQRFTSDTALGSGERRAKDYFAKQVDGAKSAPGAKHVTSGTAAGLGDEATSVGYEMTKDSQQFRNRAVVARTGNVVVTLNYNGAGYEDAKPPKADDLRKNAEFAAKKAVAAVAGENRQAAKKPGGA